MIEEVEELFLCFENMEIENKVNLNYSLPIIEKLAKNLISFRNGLLNSNTTPEKLFATYHSSFVISVILENMKQRLKKTEIMHDNPIIALNSLKVIQPMKEILLGLKEKKHMNFIQMATNLQEIAIKNDLFEIKQDRLKSADDVLKSIISNQDL